MMLEKTKELETVLNLRMQHGSRALFKTSFQEQLVTFARLNDLLGPQPGDEGCLVDQQAPAEY
jgi:hypothetical protein